MTRNPTPTTNATMAEKEQILRNDQRHTFQSRAIAEADEVRGRWAQINKATVVGSSGAPQYPQLPEASPWHNDPVPHEEPLGHAIDAHEPVGEVGEIEKSLATPSQSSHSVDARGQGGAPPTTEASVGIAQSQPAGASPTPKPKPKRGV